MQLYVTIRPDLPDGGPFAQMNPGEEEPFGVILFGKDAYVSVKTDDEARRIIEAASATIAMRKMIGTPHAFNPAGPGSVVSPRSCTECGMLGDSPDHAEPASPEAVAALADSIAPNPPYHATGIADQACRAPGNKDSGYICTAQDGHDGPDHVAYKTGGGEYHRWPVACGARPYPAGSEGDDGTECTLPAGHDGAHDDVPASVTA